MSSDESASSSAPRDQGSLSEAPSLTTNSIPAFHARSSARSVSVPVCALDSRQAHSSAGIASGDSDSLLQTAESEATNIEQLSATVRRRPLPSNVSQSLSIVEDANTVRLISEGASRARSILIHITIETMMIQRRNAVLLDLGKLAVSIEPTSVEIDMNEVLKECPGIQLRVEPKLDLFNIHSTTGWLTGKLPPDWRTREAESRDEGDYTPEADRSRYPGLISPGRTDMEINEAVAEEFKDKKTSYMVLSHSNDPNSEEQKIVTEEGRSHSKLLDPEVANLQEATQRLNDLDNIDNRSSVLVLSYSDDPNSRQQQEITEEDRFCSELRDEELATLQAESQPWFDPDTIGKSSGASMLSSSSDPCSEEQPIFTQENQLHLGRADEGIAKFQEEFQEACQKEFQQSFEPENMSERSSATMLSASSNSSSEEQKTLTEEDRLHSNLLDEKVAKLHAAFQEDCREDYQRLFGSEKILERSSAMVLSSLSDSSSEEQQTLTEEDRSHSMLLDEGFAKLQEEFQQLLDPENTDKRSTAMLLSPSNDSSLEEHQTLMEVDQSHPKLFDQKVAELHEMFQQSIDSAMEDIVQVTMNSLPAGLIDHTLADSPKSQPSFLAPDFKVDDHTDWLDGDDHISTSSIERQVRVSKATTLDGAASASLPQELSSVKGTFSAPCSSPSTPVASRESGAISDKNVTIPATILQEQRENPSSYPTGNTPSRSRIVDQLQSQKPDNLNIHANGTGIHLLGQVMVEDNVSTSKFSIDSPDDNEVYQAPPSQHSPGNIKEDLSLRVPDGDTQKLPVEVDTSEFYNTSESLHARPLSLEHDERDIYNLVCNTSPIRSHYTSGISAITCGRSDPEFNVLNVAREHSLSGSPFARTYGSLGGYPRHQMPLSKPDEDEEPPNRPFDLPQYNSVVKVDFTPPSPAQKYPILTCFFVLTFTEKFHPISQDSTTTVDVRGPNHTTIMMARIEDESVPWDLLRSSKVDENVRSQLVEIAHPEFDIGQALCLVTNCALRDFNGLMSIKIPTVYVAHKKPSTEDILLAKVRYPLYAKLDLDEIADWVHIQKHKDDADRWKFERVNIAGRAVSPMVIEIASLRELVLGAGVVMKPNSNHIHTLEVKIERPAENEEAQSALLSIFIRVVRMRKDLDTDPLLRLQLVNILKVNKVEVNRFPTICYTGLEGEIVIMDTAQSALVNDVEVALQIIVKYEELEELLLVDLPSPSDLSVAEYLIGLESEYGSIRKLELRECYQEQLTSQNVSRYTARLTNTPLRCTPRLQFSLADKNSAAGQVLGPEGQKEVLIPASVVSEDLGAAQITKRASGPISKSQVFSDNIWRRQFRAYWILMILMSIIIFCFASETNGRLSHLQYNLAVLKHSTVDLSDRFNHLVATQISAYNELGRLLSASHAQQHSIDSIRSDIAQMSYLSAPEEPQIVAVRTSEELVDPVETMQEESVPFEDVYRELKELIIPPPVLEGQRGVFEIDPEEKAQFKRTIQSWLDFF